ncbi:MAG: ferredoxin [Beggiatoa sp. IS2]|nr:MAG: ferredoxin [Beggiatoa sp. IS2]
MPRPKKHVFICVQSRPPGHDRGSCTERGCGELVDEFIKEFNRRKLQETNLVAITTTSCLGPCKFGPNVLVYPEGVMYGKVTREDVAAIYDEHLLGDKPVERLKVPDFVWE